MRKQNQGRRVLRSLGSNLKKHPKAKLSSEGESLPPCLWEPENPSSSNSGKSRPCLLGLPSGPRGPAPAVLTFSGASYIPLHRLCYPGGSIVTAATGSQHLAEKALGEDLWMRNQTLQVLGRQFSGPPESSEL